MPQQLLPRFHRRMQEIEDARKLTAILLESDATAEGPRLVNGADGHNWQRMRGLPIVARGVSGTAPGTNPVAALLRKENGRRRVL